MSEEPTNTEVEAVEEVVETPEEEVVVVADEVVAEEKTEE